jgi:ABC-type maltose transport system permease subunit
MFGAFLFTVLIILFCLIIIGGIAVINLQVYIANKFNFKIPTTSYSSKNFDKNKINKILNESENLHPTLRKCIQIILFLHKIFNLLIICLITIWIVIILIAIMN